VEPADRDEGGSALKRLTTTADGNYVVQGIPMKKFGIAHTIKILRKAKRLGKF
jgi:hypothetical protein